MNKLYLIAFTLFALSSCKDSGTSVKPTGQTPGIDSSSATFTVNGIADITVPQDSVGMLPLSVNHTNGEQKKLNLSVTGLPDGINVTFEPASGTPTFATVATIRVGENVPLGNYAVKVVAVNSSGLKKEYDFNIKVRAPYNCVFNLIGTYNRGSASSCRSKIIIKADPSNESKIIISGLAADIDATINCKAKTIVSDMHNLSSNTNLDGEIFGSFNGSVLNLTYKFRLSYSPSQQVDGCSNGQYLKQ